MDLIGVLVKHLNISYDEVDSNGFPLEFRLQLANIFENAFEFSQCYEYHGSDNIYNLDSDGLNLVNYSIYDEEKVLKNFLIDSVHFNGNVKLLTFEPRASAQSIAKDGRLFIKS